jgi:hypothetical protein
MSMDKPCSNPSWGSKIVPTADRALKLLPFSIRENLPLLGSQQHLGGRAQALAKVGTADGTFTWYITEGSGKRNRQGQAVDYLLYGLVEGERRRLDYFWLSELAAFRSPAGLPAERDAHWRPKSLAEVAPEMFPAKPERRRGDL